MIGQLMRWSALVLLVYAASSLAVDPLNITRMTWSYTSDTGALNRDQTDLTVCTTTDTLAVDGDIIRLVVGATATSQKTFDGSLGDPTSCALFSEGEELSLPSAEAAFYKLTVSNSTTGEELSTGSVSFAYPVSTPEIINCGGTKIGRLPLVEAASAPPNCFQGSGLTPELCYVDVDPGDENTVCVEGLDTNSDVVVCMANVQDSGATVPETFTVKYISYNDVNASLGVFYNGTDPGVLTELLSRVGDAGSVTVHSCSDDLSCDLDPFSPSIYNYELCGVFTDNNAVTHVGTATFQDLKLTIDSTSPTVDFHFYNVEATSYNVYKDPADLGNLGEATFTLDCTRISPGSYCNGFMLTEGNSPTTIAVSFTNVTNAVATSVDSSPPERGEAVVSRAADEGANSVDLQPSW